jgi:hypothetical protein
MKNSERRSTGEQITEANTMVSSINKPNQTMNNLASNLVVRVGFEDFCVFFCHTAVGLKNLNCT